MKSFFLLLIQFILFFSSQINCETVDVTKYGADHKGVAKSTDAIKKAIDDVVSKGGGIVNFPNGEYLTGPIHLKSKVTLHLNDKTIIKFSKDFDDYLPMVRMRWEGTEVINFSPLIYAFNVTDIGIKGKGTLDGQGQDWWTYYHELVQNKTQDSKYQKEFFRLNNLTDLAKETTDMSRMELGFLRPPFIQPFESKNIDIEGVTIKNSPFWNINPAFCEDVTIKEVKIEAPVPSPNTDGIDPDSCKNVHISKVVIDVGDDCIAIKSGRDLQARRIGRPTENMVIEDSIMLKGHSGVAIGSEMSGSVRNVTVKNCLFNGTDKGIAIKSTRGRGGVVEDIHYHNITLMNIKKEAILITLSYSPSSKLNTSKVEPFSDRTPTIRNIEVKGMTGTAHTAVTLSGIEESLLDSIHLRNIEITSESGLTVNYTKNCKIEEYVQKIK